MAGKKKFILSPEQAKRIEKLAVIGCNDNHIAAIENMSEAQLKKMYSKELSEGRAKGIGAVAQTAYQIALSGKNPAMTMFFLKCRARWQETQHVKLEADITTAEKVNVKTHWRALPKDGEGEG